jgi:hypothetical protein
MSELDRIREFQEEQEMTPEQARSLREALKQIAPDNSDLDLTRCPPKVTNSPGVTHE